MWKISNWYPLLITLQQSAEYAGLGLNIYKLCLHTPCPTLIENITFTEIERRELLILATDDCCPVVCLCQWMCNHDYGIINNKTFLEVSVDYVFSDICWKWFFFYENWETRGPFLKISLTELNSKSVPIEENDSVTHLPIGPHNILKFRGLQTKFWKTYEVLLTSVLCLNWVVTSF